VVLSHSEVKAIFDVIANLKHRVIIMTTYSGGLRVSEVAHLRVCDIDSKRMQIRVDQGKGKKDRYTLLSPALLEHLRTYWRYYHPTTWLFPGSHNDKPIDITTIQKVFKLAKKKPI
jgi:integrase/recombinase XerD